MQPNGNVLSHFKLVLIISLLMMNMTMAHAATKVEVDSNTKDELLNVFSANEKLHAAFFQYDAKEVEKQANNLKDSMEKVKNPEVAKLLKFSKQKLNEIKASKKRKENNQNYHLVSMALIHLLNKYNLGDTYGAYSCPMVKKKWIQNVKKMEEVHNPYAPEMPHCGNKN